MPISSITDRLSRRPGDLADGRDEAHRRQHRGEASRSGRPAATIAPKANSRMISVTGSDIVSAFWRSLVEHFWRALPALASPNCSIRSSGWAFCAAAVAPRTARPCPRPCPHRRDLELDEGGMAVRARLARVALGVGRLDVADLGALETPLDVADGGAEGRASLPVLLWTKTCSPATSGKALRRSSWRGRSRRRPGPSRPVSASRPCRRSRRRR